MVWRITNARMNSPLLVEITPFPKNHAENIDLRANDVVRVVASGLREFSRSGKPPANFDVDATKAAESLIKRVMNGLSKTEIGFGDDYGQEKFEIDRNSAFSFVRASQSAKEVEFRPHRELGSVEGFISKVELDGFNRPIVWLRTRISSETVKCVSNGRGLDRIGHLEVSEVLRGLRVQVYGLINYRNSEKVSSIEVDYVHVYANDSDLPSEEDILAPGFTGGLLAEEYLERQRSDD